MVVCIWAVAKQVERKRAIKTKCRVRIGSENVELSWQEAEVVVDAEGLFSVTSATSVVEKELEPQGSQRSRRKANPGKIRRLVGRGVEA
jgi:hypothetical protein